MLKLRYCLWSIVLLGAVAGSAGQAQFSARDPIATKRVRQVAVGDPVRRQILGALRPVVQKDLGQPIRFVIETMKVQAGWAFVVARPQTPTGRSIDFSKTRHAERQAAGIMDGDTLYALLKARGGTWSVLDYAMGPTDVTYAGWPDEFGAPPGLLGLRE